MLPKIVILFAAWIRLFLISQPGEVIHTGFQSKRQTAALLKRIIPLSVFQFGIIALVDSGKHLHFDLCISFFHPQLFQSVHNDHPTLLWQNDLLILGID